MKYSPEELEILNAYENDDLELTKPYKEEIEKIKSIASNTLKKDKRITIRLYDHDYRGIQTKAAEMGIPYQTLISGIIHQYIEGELHTKQS